MSLEASKYARKIGVPWHKVAKVHLFQNDDPRILELLEDLRIHSPAPKEQHVHIAKARLLSILHQEEEQKNRETYNFKRHKILHIIEIGLLVLLLLVLVPKAHCQYTNVNLLRIQGDTSFFDAGNHALKVNCVTGCSATSGFTDNTSFTVGTTTINNIGGYFTSGADPSITTGNSGRLRMDSHSYLFTDCVVGCSGGSTTPADTFTNPTTAGITFSFGAVWNGTTWDRLYGDKTNGAFVNVKTSVIPTGAALDSSLSTIDTDLRTNIVLNTGSHVVGKFDLLGNTGAILDAAGQNASSPANEILVGGQFNTSPTTITSGNISPLQLDSGGKLLVNPGTVPVTGTFFQGTQPVSIAANVATTDAATSSTGSAVPSKAGYAGGNGSGNLTGYLNCDNTAIYDAATNGSTQLVGLVSGKRVYICGGIISTSQTTAVSVKLIYGTGTACATGATSMTPAWPLQAGTSTGPIGLQIPATTTQALATAASQELCINTNAAASVQALIYWTQF